MLRKASCFAFAVLFVVGNCLPVAAQIGEPSGDSRVRRALDELELKYTINKHGNFVLTFDLGDKRSQSVIIYSKTNTYKDLEIREIVSGAYEWAGKIPHDIANHLLEASESSKLGFWTSLSANNKSMATYVVRVSANSDATNLNVAIINAANAADKMERTFSIDDQF